MKKSLLVSLIMMALCISVRAEDELVWTDMEAYPLYGKITEQTDAPYRRFPVSVEKRLPERKAPERIQDLCHCSAGLYIRFRSDAKVLKASWEVEFYDLWPFGHMTDANKRGLDIYALEDGKWVFMGVARPRDQRVNTTALTSNPEGKMREYMLYLSNYDHVKWVKIGHPKGTTLEMPLARTPRSDSPVLVYGTSITQGGCSSRPGLGYTNIMSRILDRTVINVGLSGNGCFDLPVAEYMTQTKNPSCIVLDNMANCQVETVENFAIPFISILRKAYPTVPIICVNKPTAAGRYYNADSRESGRLLNESFRKVYDQLRAEGDANIHFLDLAKEMNGCEYTVDGVHYTDPGMVELAERISEAVKDVTNILLSDSGQE